MMELRTALIVAAPEASAAVDSWLERTCRAKPSIGVPAHVTLLFPFVPAAGVDTELIEELRDIFARAAEFPFALQRLERFPKTLYLAPEPAEPFVQLTEAIVDRYPGYPPYEGAFETIVPHLTLASGNRALLDKVEADVLRALPIESIAREVILLEEVLPNWGRWEERTRFRLGS